MRVYIKIILVITSIGLLTSCSYIPWYNSTTKMDVNLTLKEKSVNSKTPFTMIVIQPAEQKDFVTESYGSLAQKSLDKGVKRYIFLPEETKHNIKIDVDDTPLAIYFVLKHQPISNWKFLITKPQGEKLSFIVNKNNVIKDS